MVVEKQETSSQESRITFIRPFSLYDFVIINLDLIKRKLLHTHRLLHSVKFNRIEKVLEQSNSSITCKNSKEHNVLCLNFIHSPPLTRAVGLVVKNEHQQHPEKKRKQKQNLCTSVVISDERD